jgi:hypothetical protein
LPPLAGSVAAWIDLGFESLHSERMPIDVVLGQLPRRSRTEYPPIGLPMTRAAVADPVTGAVALRS